MKSVWIIYKKDVFGFFTLPLFYMVAGLCTLFWSPLYVSALSGFLNQVLSVIGQGEIFVNFHLAVVKNFVAVVNFTLLLFANGITMRLLAEEKKNHTYELLMTSPVASWQIVLAKYLAGVTVALALIFISLLYPMSTALLGKIQWAPLWTCYVGLILFALVYIAVGLLGSALVASPMMAFLISLILNLSLLFLGAGADMTANETVARFFNYINWEPIFNDFISGVIRMTSVVYLLSLAFLAVICAERLTESSRWK